MVELRSESKIVDENHVRRLDRKEEFLIEKIALYNIELKYEKAPEKHCEPFHATCRTSACEYESYHSFSAESVSKMSLIQSRTCAYSAGISCFSMPMHSTHPTSPAT
jgi:hypothetical protein